MQITVLAPCPTCGVVEMTDKDVQLSINPQRGPHYTFDCPSCGAHVCKEASEHHVNAILATSRVATVYVPPETISLPLLVARRLVEFFCPLQVQPAS
jgi:endogenous inhibitor of DNA gyrase (YacG/DUF329 family)